MKTYIMIELKPDQKELIVRGSKKLGLGHSTFCRMVAMKEAEKILGEEK